MRNLLILTISLVPTLALARPSPSVSCVFTEPFATIQIWPGHMRAQIEGADIAATDIVVGGTRGEPIITALVGGVATTLSLTNQEGSDGMSDVIYPFEGILTGWTMGTTPISGGCTGFQAGSKPFNIIELGQDAKLNLRAQPSARARILHEIGSQDVVWSTTGTSTGARTGGWVRVAARVVPSNGQGKVKVATGWVRASYLRQVVP